MAHPQPTYPQSTCDHTSYDQSTYPQPSYSQPSYSQPSHYQPTSSSIVSYTAKETPFPSGSDGESQEDINNPAHWCLVLYPSGVTNTVFNYGYPGHGTPESPFIVDFLPQDGSNPLQYSQAKKWAITALQALATLAVAFSSTAYSGGVFEIVKYFHVSTIVAILGVSLFVLGFAIGPLLWAPLSGMSSSSMREDMAQADGGHRPQSSTEDRSCSSSPTWAWSSSAPAPPGLKTCTHWLSCASSPARLARRRSRTQAVLLLICSMRKVGWSLSLNRRAMAADDPLLQSVARRQVSLPWPPFSVPPSVP